MCFPLFFSKINNNKKITDNIYQKYARLRYDIFNKINTINWCQMKKYFKKVTLLTLA